MKLREYAKNVKSYSLNFVFLQIDMYYMENIDINCRETLCILFEVTVFAKALELINNRLYNYKYIITMNSYSTSWQDLGG